MDGPEEGDPAPAVNAGDKETKRFMRWIRKGVPERNSWVQESPGDRYIIFHGGKTVNIRRDVRVLSLLLKNQGTDNKSQKEGRTTAESTIISTCMTRSS